MINVRQMNCEITEIAEYKGDVDGEHVLVKTFKLGLDEPLNYKPGQFAMLSHPDFKNWTDHSKLKEAAFSICSSPAQNGHLEFCIRVHDTPGLTNFIGTKLGVGDKLNVKAPFGVFTLREGYSDNIFISSGTGIAPMISMARYLSDIGDTACQRFFYGFWNSRVFPFKKEIERLRKNRNFEFIPIISSKLDSEWAGQKGFVQDALASYDFSFPKEKTHAYICGNPRMMSAVLELLPKLGLKPENM